MSSARVRTTLTAAGLFAGALLLYARDLGTTPIYLHHDEVLFGVQAQAVASTWRDTHGRFLPAYFEVYDAMWFQPIIVYFTALFLTVLPLSEQALRLPSVVIAGIDVVLMYAIGRRLFEREWLAIGAAVGLALTPAHFIFGRMAIDNLYPVTFLLGWLWCLLVFLERRDARLLWAASILLGVGRYSYIAANIMMPLYVVMTLAILYAIGASWRLYAVAVSGFVAPLLLSVPFLVRYPQFLAETLSRYAPRSTIHLDPLQQASELLNYTNLSDRVGLFFSFFNPGFLFLSGGGNPVISTRTAGVFLLPLAVLLPVGIYHACHRYRGMVSAMLVAGFFTAPVAAMVVHESEAIDRELAVLPFGVLLATFGLQYLWSAPIGSLRRFYRPVAVVGVATALAYGVWSIAWRGRISSSTLPLVVASVAVYAIGTASDRVRRWWVMTLCLLVLGVVQFRSFYTDYFSAYRIRSAGRFESNRRGAFEAVMAREDPARPAKVYLSRSIPFGDAVWTFYRLKQHREDLRDAAVVFDAKDFDGSRLPEGTFVVVAATAAADEALSRQPALAVVAQIGEPDRSVSFIVLKKQSR